jgi:molybdopterin biosynthesis enzyme MoaB
MIKAAILTVSDSCARGEREDISGQTIEDILAAGGFEICERRIVADDREGIADELKSLSDKRAVDVVLS